MRRSILLTLALVVVLFSAALPVAAQQGPRTRIEEWTLDEVADWRAGTNDSLLITNNAGGELRLAEDQTSGSFLSAPFEAEFAFNAAGAVWRAEQVPGTQLSLELRARVTPPPSEGDPEEGWGAWQPLSSGDARSQSDDGAFATPNVLAFPADSKFLQVRVSLGSDVLRASTVLDRVTISYLSTAQANPVFSTGLPRKPILFGKETLTTRPVLVARSDWSGTVEAVQVVRRNPRGIIIHQIDAPSSSETSLDLLRALFSYQTDVLGWDDLSYHYIIDAEGTLFEGRLGGPTAEVGRLSGGDSAVHIALITPRDSAPSELAQGVLINLLAWLGQAYDIAPTGQHLVVNGTNRSERPNIAGHNEAAAEAADPYQPVRDLLPQFRTQADQSTVRARWYFAEGNVADYSERMVFYNPTGAAADATVTFIRPGENPLIEIVNVPAGGRSDLIVNDLVSDATALPAVVESSAEILVERSMSLTTDVDGGPGISKLSRVWYFAEGSTEGTNRTYLVLFNPQVSAVSATVTYMRDDGTQFEQQVQIGGQDRLVIAVNDFVQDANFGMRVIANQPIAVERTMRFGENATGLHTGRGIDTLSRRWIFAEGTTESGFQMRLLVLNPNNQPTNAEAVFMGPDGDTETRRYAIPPRSQLSILVNDVIPGLGVSSVVYADRPVAVERALLFNNGAAGSIGVGATAPAYQWTFVDGRTNDVNYYLCVSNPNNAPATVTVDFTFGDGAVAEQTFTVPAKARYTLAVQELFPDEPVISAVVRGTQPIVAERSLFPGNGTRGGSTTLGIPAP